RDLNPDLVLRHVDLGRPALGFGLVLLVLQALLAAARGGAA
ncbi:MAG: hypothetical protein ACI8PZ_007499, partial [Myxococcota bacterium]